jgi:putative ABC transport system permease protein
MPHIVIRVQLLAAIRALAHRGGSTLVILVVAVVAAAAAAAGPTYFEASKVSILHDTLSHGDVIGRGYEATQTGAVSGLQPMMTVSVQADLGTVLGGGLSVEHRLFAPPIQALEVTAEDRQRAQEALVASRTNVCAHLRIIQGACATAPNQVTASKLTMIRTGWHLGQRIRLAGFRPLRIVGVYQVPDLNADYWFDRSQTYFPLIEPALNKAATAGGGSYDALFTPPATMAATRPNTQGTAVTDDELNVRHLALPDIQLLSSAITALTTSPDITNLQIQITSSIPASFTTLQQGGQALEVPVFLITLQLLTLSWLLLFLCVTDAVQARGSEIALAKLRGHGRLRVVTFGVSEPLTLLVLALPLGTVAGWAATLSLAKVLLVPGTAVGLPWAAWAAAGIATAGGIVAVIAAARRTLRQPVAEQWRRSSRQATNRGWVIDSILLTGASAGLLQLLLTGQIGTASHSVLSLLVPGLLGLAVAVAASRLLPMACRALFRRSGRRGRYGLYLAIRHIARRPGGVRTTIVLATAFALASFAVTAWSVSRDNYVLVAETQTGAPAVLTVSAPQDQDLGAIVDRADPSGKMATAVDYYTSLTSGNTSGVATIGVDPQRFARIANWQHSFSAQSLPALMAKIDPPAPAAPIVLNGDAFRVRVAIAGLNVPTEQLAADVTLGASPVDLGPLPAHGTFTRTGQLVGCPCVLQDLNLSPTPAEISSPTSPADVSGQLTLISLQIHQGGRWRSVGAAALRSAAAWRPQNSDRPKDVVSASPGGVIWSFKTPINYAQILDAANRPVPLPAVVSRNLVANPGAGVAGTGLDGSNLTLAPVFPVAAIPGAPSYGFIVDRNYAELAASHELSQVSQQVWLAAGAQPVIEPRLKAAGVEVISVTTSAAAAKVLERQGPALASVLFLADAGAAALLASGAAILALYLSARRRRYDYAALAASGVNHRTLRRSVLIELGVVLGYGMIVGVLTGIAAAGLALRSIPEFVSTPVAPPLQYVPPAVPLAVLLGGAVGLLVITALISSTTLIMGVRLEQLREAPA